MKKIIPKFQIGQKVYYIDEKCEQKVPCFLCKGKRKVKLKNKEYECPECHGDGYKINLISEIQFGEIDGLHISACESFLQENYIVDGIDICVEDLFLTKDEALKKFKELEKEDDERRD